MVTSTGTGMRSPSQCQLTAYIWELEDATLCRQDWEGREGDCCCTPISGHTNPSFRVPNTAHTGYSGCLNTDGNNQETRLKNTLRCLPQAWWCPRHSDEAAGGSDGRRLHHCTKTYVTIPILRRVMHRGESQAALGWAQGCCSSPTRVGGQLGLPRLCTTSSFIFASLVYKFECIYQETQLLHWEIAFSIWTLIFPSLPAKEEYLFIGLLSNFYIMFAIVQQK